MISTRVLPATVFLGLLTAATTLAQTPTPVRFAATPDAGAAGTFPLVERQARLNVARVALEAALLELTKRSNVPLAFSPARLPASSRVSCDCYDATVGEALDQLLAGTSLSYSELAGQIVVQPAAHFESAPRLAVRNVGLLASATPRMVTRLPELRRVRAIREQAPPGRVVGTVTDQASGAPIATVQVFLEGTGIGSLTGETGAFVLANVPAGTYTLHAERLGYQELRQTGVTVRDGQTTTVNLAMSETVLALQGIVVTGLVDPVEGVRSPIAVGRVTREMVPVMIAGSSVQNIQGRLAGVRINRLSGQPGEDVTIVLRTPTSLRGGTHPLIVVDGVILGGTGENGTGVPSTADIDPNDIESIEVIRGAAASSLYGSRAAAGVISITTKRGRELDLGDTRFTARSEYGVSQNLRNIPLNNSHAYRMNADRTAYVNAQGVEVPRSQRVLPLLAVAFMDKPYPDPIYDNIRAATRPGGFRNNNFQISGRTASTNFAVSLNNFVEQGTLVGNKGYQRNAFRVNLDHRFIDALNLGVSVYHARDSRDNLFIGTGAGSGNPFDLVLAAPRDVDLTRKDEKGNYLQQPDPRIAYQNPLWTQATRDNSQKGARTLGNLTLGWTPFSWLSASGLVSYDRDDGEIRNYTPKGTPANVGQEGELDGAIFFRNELRDTWNAEAQVSLRRNLGLLNVRTTVRGLIEATDTRRGDRSGENFILVGIPQLSNIRDTDRDATSVERQIRSTGYLWDTALEYDGKYILTVLGRRDGSSLFGRDNRWHNYYRVAGAWRVGEEPWFNVPGVTELKLSLARGTAGGRPEPDYQYETWRLSGGVPTKGTLGNSELRPEHSLEHELSMNLVLFNRFGFVVTHARRETSDLLNPVPLPAFTGYSSQWVNAGTISGHSTEFEFEAHLIQRPNVSWSSLVVADYSNARITEWNIPCYAQAWRWNCVDIPVYGLYSRWLVKSHAGLNQHDSGSLLPRKDEFEVNDEGFLVWVGKGNRYWEGIEKSLWGTSTVINGKTYKWGHPFFELTEQGLPHRTLLGEGTPANFGWINNVRVGALSFHAALHAAIGGQANNRRHQLIGRTPEPGTAPHMDQAGKPDGLKKPIDYYRSAQDGDNSYATEDASYLKLRTLSVSYRMDQSRIARFGLGRAGIRDLTLGLTARNVFTLTNYEGFDPEGALNLNDRTNSDTSGYPPTRTLTAEITITF